MSDAISAYHDLLSSGGTLAADSQAALERAQERRGLQFGTRPVCAVLRPRFLTPSQYRLLHETVGALLPAFKAVYDRALADPPPVEGQHGGQPGQQRGVEEPGGDRHHADAFA